MALHGAKPVICPFKRALQASGVVERVSHLHVALFCSQVVCTTPHAPTSKPTAPTAIGSTMVRCKVHASWSCGRPSTAGKQYVHMCAGHHVPHTGDLPPQTALLALLPPSAAMLFVGYSNPANPTPANPRLLLVKNSWCVESRFSAKLAMLLHLARVLGWIRALPLSAGHCSWRAAGCTAAAC